MSTCAGAFYFGLGGESGLYQVGANDTEHAQGESSPVSGGQLFCVKPAGGLATRAGWDPGSRVSG